jgi:DNA polymerase-3 subunit epsilon
MIDVETTGLNAQTDELIEIAFLPFTATISGQLISTEATVRFLRDPGIPIPIEITSLTGITDAMVAGQSLDVSRIDALLTATHVVIAHNAAFDRVVVERYVQAARTARWGCSQRDVPWRTFGFSTQKLEWLLYSHAGFFNADAHRAGADCAAALVVLVTPFPDGSSPLRQLLDAVRTDTTRFWATNAPFEMKDLLKARGYGWNDGSDGRPKAWSREVKPEEVAAERDWLRDSIYQGRSGFREGAIDAKLRYSTRA